MVNVIIIVAVFYFPFERTDVKKFRFKKSENVLQSNWQWIGPEGGIISKPLSHPSLTDRVLAPSMTDIWKKENGENFFRIVNGLDYVFPIYNSPGILSSPSKGIVASRNGLYFTQDNWQTIDTTSWSSEIMFISGDHSDTVYLISLPDSLFKSLDGGQSFNFVSNIPGINILSDTNYIISVDPSNSDNIGVFSFGPPAIFYYSQDGGNTFEMRDTLPLGMITSLRISPFNSNTMLAFVPDTGILMTNDGGFTWNHLATLALFGVLSASDGIFVYPDTIIISSVLNPGIFKSYQVMGNWIAQPCDTTSIPFMFEKAGNRIYCGSNNGIYVSFNNGNSWTNLKDSLRACIFMERGMFSIVRDTVCVIDMGGIPFKFYGTQTPSEMNFLGHPSFFGYSCISFSKNSTSTIFLSNPHMRFSGTNLIIHTLWVSNDGGNSFSPVNDSTDLLSYSDIMLGNSDSTIFMYNDSNLVRSFDAGNSFDTIFSISSGINLCDNFRDTIFVLTEGDTIFYSYDAGTSFGFLFYLPGIDDMSYDEANRILYLSDPTNLYSLNIETNNLDTIFLSSYNINSIYASEDGWVYALLSDTSLQQFIYYTQGAGTPVFVDTVLSNVYFNGIVAGNGNLVYAHPGGRSIFATNLIKVDEYEATHKYRLILGNVFRDYLYFNSNIDGLKFEIYDLSGRKLNHRINLLNGRIRISELKSGAYILKEKNTGKKFKVIKID